MGLSFRIKKKRKEKTGRKENNLAKTKKMRGLSFRVLVYVFAKAKTLPKTKKIRAS